MRFLPTLLPALIAGLLLLPLRAEDWTIPGGQTYHNVKVLSHDAAYVTILHADGGGKIPLSTLTPDLQKRFGYDAAKATQAIAAQKTADQQNRLALLQEKERIEAAHQQEAADALTAALFAPPPDADVPPAGTPNTVPPPQQGLVAGYEIPDPPIINGSDYGDWGYGGYVYNYVGYGSPIYSYGGYGYGGYRHTGTRGFAPGSYHGTGIYHGTSYSTTTPYVRH